MVVAPDDLLRPDVVARDLSAGLWTVLPPEQEEASYDRIAALYDAVIGNPLYNRLIWGAWSSAYTRAARQALDEAGAGPVLDCGCGSLVFTQAAYADFPGRLVLFDRSQGMLRRGLRRYPSGTFLQGDLLTPPFAEAAFSAVMCWGVLHLFASSVPILELLNRLVRPEGLVTVSALVLTGRARGDRMLHLLHRKGEAALPQQAADVERRFGETFAITRRELHGNMLILTGRRQAMQSVGG